MELSVVIINFNTKELLRACIDSVLQESATVNLEIIVVDNNSSDGSHELLSHHFPNVRTIFNSDNKGFAAANNQGVEIAKGEYILLLNSDTKIIKGAIRDTFNFITSSNQDSIIGCKLLNQDRTLQPSCRSFPSIVNLFSESFFLYKLFPKNKIFGQYHMSYFGYDTICEVDVVKGAFMMMKQKLFNVLGGFDQSYFMYTEETDFCFRAKRNGYKTLFFPDAQIIHFEGGSVQHKIHHYQQIHESQLQFIRKHFFGAKKIVALFIKYQGIINRIFVYFLVGVIMLKPALIKKSWYYLRSL